MSKRGYNKYSLEFKVSSVKLALESDQPIAQTARDLGVNPSTLHTWIGKESNFKKSNNNMVKNSECYFEEVKKLRKELSIVKQERYLLKKAAVYFAKQSQ